MHYNPHNLSQCTIASSLLSLEDAAVAPLEAVDLFLFFSIIACISGDGAIKRLVIVTFAAGYFMREGLEGIVDGW